MEARRRENVLDEQSGSGDTVKRLSSPPYIGLGTMALVARPMFHMIDVILPKIVSTIRHIVITILSLLLPRYFFEPKQKVKSVEETYVDNCPGTYVHKGMLLPSKYGCPSVARNFENFETRDDDVLIVSYPKSGFTWTEEIVSQIYNDGDSSRITESLEFRVVHVEVGMPLMNWYYLNNIPSPRLLGTHLRCDMLPKQLLQGKGKMIYVARNGKDNAVSYFHHHRICRQMGFFKGSWDDFYHLYMNGHLIWGSWFDHLKSYAEHAHHKNILYLTYEEMKEDLQGNVLKICEFLGRSLSEEAVQNIVHNCSFAQMKKNCLANREDLVVRNFDFKKNGGTKFCRKGVVGDWQNYFTDEQSEEFDAIYQRDIESQGFKFDFLPETEEDQEVKVQQDENEPIPDKRLDCIDKLKI